MIKLHSHWLYSKGQIDFNYEMNFDFFFLQPNFGNTCTN